MTVAVLWKTNSFSEREVNQPTSEHVFRFFTPVTETSLKIFHFQDFHNGMKIEIKKSPWSFDSGFHISDSGSSVKITHVLKQRQHLNQVLLLKFTKLRLMFSFMLPHSKTETRLFSQNVESLISSRLYEHLLLNKLYKAGKK